MRGGGVMISLSRDRGQVMSISNRLGSRARIHTRHLGSKNSNLNLCIVLGFKFCEMHMQSSKHLKEFYNKHLQQEGKQERKRGRGEEKETGIARRVID